MERCISLIKKITEIIIATQQDPKITLATKILSKYRARDRPHEQGQNSRRKPIGLLSLVTLMKFFKCAFIIKVVNIKH